MSREARAWSGAVQTALDATSSDGWWPHIRLTEHPSGILEASVVGSRDRLVLPGIQSLAEDQQGLVKSPEETVPGLGAMVEDPTQVNVFWDPTTDVVQLDPRAVSAFYDLNKRLGIRALYEHSMDPRVAGLIGSAAVFPESHVLQMETEAGVVATGPIDDNHLAVGALRAALAYTFDTFDPGAHHHPH